MAAYIQEEALLAVLINHQTAGRAGGLMKPKVDPIAKNSGRNKTIFRI